MNDCHASQITGPVKKDDHKVKKLYRPHDMHDHNRIKIYLGKYDRS